MEAEDKMAQEAASFFAKQKNVSVSEYTNNLAIYHAEMTVSQANAISALLPLNYSIHVDRNVKQKRNIKRTFTLDSKSKEIREVEDSHMQNQPGTPQESGQFLSDSDLARKCLKVLTALKKNKNSWPFLEPVDPIFLGIPHYLDIVREPMDLATVSRNLSEGRYSTISHFYADIELIISNSLLFNRANPDFCKITNDFKKCFDKLVAEGMQQSSSHPSRKGANSRHGALATQKSRNEKDFLTISEKKQLAMKIKSLPIKNIIEIAELVTNAPVSDQLELNLETLSQAQLRKIQDYLRRREHDEQVLFKESRAQQAQESSFKSDSDS